MKIRTKLILNYSILSFILLLVFSVIVVFAYIKYRQSDFLVRLQNRATSTANLLVEESNIDEAMLKLIDKNIITAMADLQITIYGHDSTLIYSNSSSINAIGKDTQYFPQPLLSKMFGIGFKTIYFSYFKNGHHYFIEASAIDKNGLNELKSLLKIIGWVLGFSLILMVAFGFYNATWSLKPFQKIIKEIESIEPEYIRKRVTVMGNDEISQLAKSFNTLLDQIEQAFETEKSFISNASHELRTPVTSVLGQIEVGLNKSRNEEEYKALLQSVYDDTNQMATIINGFLDLAEASLSSNLIKMNPVMIDDLIFSVVEDFERKKPIYSIQVDYKTNPDNDSQLECKGNERLMRVMFSNLIDNACKYSSDKKAFVSIDYSDTSIFVSIMDHGIGIPSEDIEKIFKPLYRASNTYGEAGHGIGLAIVKRIADLHEASIEIKSDMNIGTTVIVKIRI